MQKWVCFAWPFLLKSMLLGGLQIFDVAIISGGACGCSLLHELSCYKVNAVFLEREDDISVGTTKANNAIIYAGYGPEPGALMAHYNVGDNRIIEQLYADLDILHNRIGSLILGFSGKDRATVEALCRRGAGNGVPGLRAVEREELHRMEPALSKNALFAFWASNAAVVGPWELATAQAEVAVQGGAKVMLGAEVTGIEKNGDVFTIETSQGPVRARFVVNAASVRTDRIAAMVDDNSFQVIPNRGEYFVLDTTQGRLVSRVIFQCPTKVGRDVLVFPTVYGSLIVRPNAEDVSVDGADTTSVGLHNAWQAAIRSVSNINFRDSIRNFAGIHTISTQDDFIVEPSEACKGFSNIAGVRPPGLTSSPTAARDVVQMLHHVGLELSPNPNFVSKRCTLRFKLLNPRKCGEVILHNPLYGTIMCRYGTVTEGEVVDVMHRPLPPRSVDGIKRRCTSGMGHCQGGFCGPRTQAVIARELGTPESQVSLDRTGMHIILDRTGEQKEAGK